MTRRCEWCPGELPTLARADARFCSTRCRVAAHRAAAPAELRTRPRWVRYSSHKVPLTVDGKPASSTNPETWAPHRTVARSKVGRGAGFVLNGDGVVCLDLDHVLVDGRPTQAAVALLRRFPKTYIERSPSGHGLHVWGYGIVEQGRRMTVDGVDVEVYGTGRYITVTGDATTRAPFADLSTALISLI